MFQPVPQVLQHASYIPFKPAEVFAERDINGPAMPFTPFDIRIGDGDVRTFEADPAETYAQFFARIVASGLCVDENGKNPLSIAMEPGGIAFRSGARIRFGGFFAYPFFFGEPDVSPVLAQVFDTTTDHVRHGDAVLFEVLAARFFDPRTVVAGLRSHELAPTLVSLGATEGDMIEVYHGGQVGQFLVEASSTAFDFAGFVSGPALNTAPGSHVVGYLDGQFYSIVVFSKIQQQIVIQATRSATLTALLGALPT